MPRTGRGGRKILLREPLRLAEHRCIRCAKRADSHKGMIRPPLGDPIGPFCQPCRRKFIHGLTRAEANKSHYRSTYGLMLSEYGQVYALQRGLCAICHDRRAPGKDQRALEDKTGALVVDHDHETGEVRGLLCSRCNTAIGMFRDDPALLASAIIYLNTQLPLRVVRRGLGEAEDESAG